MAGEWHMQPWHPPADVDIPKGLLHLVNLLRSFSQGRPDGKLYSYNPTTKETHLLVKDLWYSNGVAVAEDGSYAVISETDRLRLLKYWLKGPKVWLCQ